MKRSGKHQKPTPQIQNTSTISNMKRSILFVTLLLVLLSPVGCNGINTRYDYIITQKQIDDALKAKFPVTKNHLLLFRVTFSNPHVALLPDSNRIEIGLDAELNIKLPSESKKLSGTIVVSSGIGYKNDSKQFVLSSPVIDKLEIQGIPQQHIDKVTEFASNAAREYLQEFPIYTLTDKDAKTSLAKILLKDVQVKSSEIHVTIGL